MFTLATVLLVVNFLFWLWVAYCICMPREKGLDLKGDDLFPGIALGVFVANHWSGIYHWTDLCPVSKCRWSAYGTDLFILYC